MFIYILFLDWRGELVDANDIWQLVAHGDPNVRTQSLESSIFIHSWLCAAKERVFIETTKHFFSWFYVYMIYIELKSGETTWYWYKQKSFLYALVLDPEGHPNLLGHTLKLTHRSTQYSTIYIYTPDHWSQGLVVVACKTEVII